MAVESVGSSATAYSAVSRQDDETRQAAEARRAERQATQAREQVARTDEEAAPKPVKNAEGQTTGTRVNVTA